MISFDDANMADIVCSGWPKLILLTDAANGILENKLVDIYDTKIVNNTCCSEIYICILQINRFIL